MDENKVMLAKKDNRVQFDFLIHDKIHVFTALPKNKFNKIIIYCHGLGSDKSWIIRYYEELLENNIGVIAFDLPGHGMDKTSFSKFNLDLCIFYLEEVIEYVKNTYQAKIYLFGSSYGGFVTLNKLMKTSIGIEKTILMCPAINFCEITQRIINISADYFETHDFVPLFGTISLSKKVYFEFQNGEDKIKEHQFHDVCIIHGMKDKTVLCSDVEKFCVKNDLSLKIIEEAKHELHGYEENVVAFILNVIDDNE